MDRRVLVKSLFGVAGAGALALILPPHAEALVGLPRKASAPDSGVLPNLEELKKGAEDGEAPEDGFQLAQYYYRHRHYHGHYRRHYRRWRWRRYCRRRWWHGYYRHRCYRRRVMFWIWI
jgi:hypothetical protein